MTYWLTVQKMRGGKPFEEPFRSSGQEIFENGYGFRLNVASPRPGYLYVSRGRDRDGDMSFTILYPTRRPTAARRRLKAIHRSKQTGTALEASLELKSFG